MTEDQVAWTRVEPGWRVVASDGADAGTVKQAVGDRDADIFEGFAIDVGSGGTRFLAHDQIESFVPEAVHTRLSGPQLRELPLHDALESVRIEADPATLREDGRPWWRRLLGLR